MATLPIGQLERALIQIKPLEDEATPEQAVKIALLEMRYLAIKGDYSSAMERFHWLEEQQMAPDYRLRAYSLAVQINEITRDFVAAFTYLNKAQQLLSWVNSPRLNYHVLASAASLVVRAGEKKNALKMAEQALSWAELGKNERDLCVAWNILGDIQLENSMLGKAEHSYKESLAYAEKLNLVLFQGTTLQALGDIENERGNFQTAIEYYQDARPKLQAADYRQGLDDSELGLAESYFAIGDFSSVLALLNSMLLKLEASDDPVNLKRAYLLMSRVEEATGNAIPALEWHRKYASAVEQNVKRNETVALARQKVEFDITTKEQRISLLEEQTKRLEIEERVAKQQKTIFILGLAAILITSLLLALLLIRSHREKREFRRLSRLDSLTGLNNHKTTYELAQEAFLYCQINKRPFTAVIGDIDFFKQVNDNYGHTAGDEVLKVLAAHMQQYFTGEAIVGRTGGEEFSFFFPNVDDEQVVALVEGFQQTLQPAILFNKMITITMSFGLATVKPEHKLLDTVVRNADSALYKAKRSGRNQLVKYQESETVVWDPVQPIKKTV